MQQLAIQLSRWAERNADMLPPQARKSHLVGMGFAIGCAFTRPIPASPVNDPREYFVINHYATIEDQLNRLNESVIVEFDYTLRLTEQLWLSRYRGVHEPFNAETFNNAVSRVLYSDVTTDEIYTHVNYEDLRKILFDIVPSVYRNLDDEQAEQQESV